ncbi:CRISPR-associated helicase Cas3' [Lipingzhangella sp. LS1_29]|uniref:CRISPR-associated helicase Cas3 n=1 Tax=Lipingzhangella rawalii TaxID=2055835 RepID=A0ABU2H688_9ACTN|nr:CRISPR-associated helicase Cas3' [Lipingzhangella rawalii]MDS1270527.1 CRISPR-associated helicase Cas3' [Lipingzhangella rawalii]
MARSTGGVGPVTGPLAKSGKNPEHVHPLVCHTIDTAVVAEVMYSRVVGPRVRDELQRGLRPLGDPERWVAVLCGLHDLGKCSPAFQGRFPGQSDSRLAPEAQEVLNLNRPNSGVPRVDIWHSTLSALHMSDMLTRLGAPEATVTGIADILGGHHGWFPAPGAVRHAQDYAAQHGGRDWHAARDDLVRTVLELWGLDPQHSEWPQVELSVIAAVGLAGLTTISDWIASDASRFPYHPQVGDLVAYRDYARKVGKQIPADLAWNPWSPPKSPSYHTLFPNQGEPRGLQRAVERLVAGCVTPGVMMIEAPTGEGKTRAGLIAAAALARNLGLSGLYVALPTRALSRQSHHELQETLVRTGSPLRAHRVYSGAQEDRATDEPPVRPTDVGADGAETFIGRDERDEDSPLSWFVRKRGLLFPIGTGTIDQALYAVNRSRHNFVRLTGLSTKVLLVDEAHSYDAFTNREFTVLMWWCGRLGIPVVLMSATLPAHVRVELVAQWQAGNRGETRSDAHQVPKGTGTWAVSWYDGHRQVARQEFAPIRHKRVKLTHMPDDFAAIANAVLRRVEGGGCAMIVLNTVSRVQRMWQCLQKSLLGLDGPPHLVRIHGQLDDSERRDCEAEVLGLLGTTARQDRHGIVVGTSVLEHGLDVCADLLVSDLCPVDLLLQRLGRLHRDDTRSRPDQLTIPELLLVDSTEHLEGGSGAAPAADLPAGHTRIHPPLLLRGTRGLLRTRTEVDLPTEIPRLVHQLYGGLTNQEREELWRWGGARRIHQAAAPADPGDTQPTGEAELTAAEERVLAGDRATYARRIDRGEFRGNLQCVPLLLDRDHIGELTRQSVSPKTREGR